MFIGLDGVTVIMPACSARDLGSIPGRGEVHFQPTTTKIPYMSTKNAIKIIQHYDQLMVRPLRFMGPTDPSLLRRYLNYSPMINNVPTQNISLFQKIIQTLLHNNCTGSQSIISG